MTPYSALSPSIFMRLLFVCLLATGAMLFDAYTKPRAEWLGPLPRAQDKIDAANALIAATRKALGGAIDELNLRMSRAGIPLAYHHGLFQIRSETAIAQRIVEPFWQTFSDAK